MQIIIVDRRWAHARTLNLSRWTLAIGGVVAVLTVLLAVAALYAVTFRVATGFRVPVLHDIVSFIMRDEVDRANQFARDNVSAMARKLGEMQAQLLRLDALGERVSKVAGIRPEEFNFKEVPGRGGAAPANARLMTMDELQAEIWRSAKSLDQRADYMDVIESELLSTSVRNALLPRNTPVIEGFVGSAFGMRADPFTGQYSMHSGVDFAAPSGTFIFAAAGGVVTMAEVHPAYGNTIQIDHGNDLSTLYAHASRIDVKVGDLVKRGQKIGAVGSTGRSTGPHLHFEVHVKGVPQNPSRFLAGVKPGSPLAPLVGREAITPLSASPTLVSPATQTWVASSSKEPVQRDNKRAERSARDKTPTNEHAASTVSKSSTRSEPAAAVAGKPVPVEVMEIGANPAATVAPPTQ